MARKSKRTVEIGVLAGIALASLAACGPRTGQGINDPYEAQNRRIYAFNRTLDRRVVRPTARGYGGTAPGPLRRGVANFADNLDLPDVVLNDVLQFRLGTAVENSGRFLFNSTIGLAGILDPATAIGMPEQETDFGETLYLWGVPEGAYLMLPVLGPSTQRAAAGTMVDTLANPVRLVLAEPESYVALAADAAEVLGDREEYGEFIDEVLYESADGYAQARLQYLQNRRFELGGESGQEYVDPYEDPYAQ